MHLPSASINSLPPELLALIVHCAAECDCSLYAHTCRVKVLSALCLVNRSFRLLAQPLLASIVWLITDRDLRPFLDQKLACQVPSLACVSVRDWRCRSVPVNTPKPSHFHDFPFKFLRELGCFSSNNVNGLSALHGHEHLTRLAAEFSSFAVFDSDTVFPRLEELSLKEVSVYHGTSPGSRRSDPSPFFSSFHFPSLRALGLCRLWLHLGSIAPSLSSPFLNQLDALSTDSVQAHCPSEATESPAPLLFDHNLSGGSSLEREIRFLRIPTSTQRFVRVRLSDDWTKDPKVDVALGLVEHILQGYTSLEQLYLDPAISGYKYAIPTEEVKDRIKRVEVTAQEKGIEIIWESDEDDLLRSLVSKEFWKRARQLKGDK